MSDETKPESAESASRDAANEEQKKNARNRKDSEKKKASEQDDSSSLVGSRNLDPDKIPVGALSTSADAVNPTQVALGMQFMMQRSSFDQLSEDVQKRMIEAADTLDKRGFDYSCKRLDEKGALRRWTVVPICFFALLLLGGGFFFANKLIDADQFDKAWTVMMAGFGVIGALLGGAGLTSVLKGMNQS